MIQLMGLEATDVLLQTDHWFFVLFVPNTGHYPRLDGQVEQDSHQPVVVKWKTGQTRCDTVSCSVSLESICCKSWILT